MSECGRKEVEKMKVELGSRPLTEKETKTRREKRKTKKKKEIK